MIIATIFVSILLFVNMLLVIGRNMHVYEMRVKHIDSLYRVRDALRVSPTAAAKAIADEIRRA